NVSEDRLTVGAPLTKDLAAYWEVPLRTEEIEQLVTMDVCYVSAVGDGMQITHQERELLRRLADAGVLLWFDDPGGWSFSGVDGLFLPLNFTSGGGGATP